MEDIKKIDSKNVEDIWYLSAMQEGMLFHYINEKNSEKYFAQICYRLSGNLDKDILVVAWQSVVNNNEMLRTIFRWKHLERPIQIILKKYPVPFYEYEFCCTEEVLIEKRMKELVEADRRDKIDITIEPFRIKLYKFPQDKWFMVVSSYNIIYDGWSNGIILKELIEAYEILYDRRHLNNKQKAKFKEFIKWQLEKDTKLEIEYWKKNLSKLKSNNLLNNTSCSNSQLEKCENYSCVFSLEDETLINNFTRKRKITLATLIYTSWAILLHKYSVCEEVIFGVTVSGRPPEINGIDDVVGLYINTIPIRLKLKFDTKICDLIDQVNSLLIDGKEHQYTSIVNIMSAAKIKSIKDLFQSVIVVQNYPLNRLLFENNKNLNIELYSKFDMTDFPITLGLTIFNGIEIDVRYHSNMFSQIDIENIVNSLRIIINEIITSNDEKNISQIVLVDYEKKNQVLNNINANKQKLYCLKEVDFDEVF